MSLAQNTALLTRNFDETLSLCLASRCLSKLVPKNLQNWHFLFSAEATTGAGPGAGVCLRLPAGREGARAAKSAGHSTGAEVWAAIVSRPAGASVASPTLLPTSIFFSTSENHELHYFCLPPKHQELLYSCCSSGQEFRREFCHKKREGCEMCLHCVLHCNFTILISFWLRLTLLDISNRLSQIWKNFLKNFAEILAHGLNNRPRKTRC